MSLTTPNPPATPPPAAPAGPQGGGASSPDGPTRTVKVMAILIAVLSGTLGALLAFVLTRHLGATGLVAAGSAGVTFLGVAGTVKYIEEKLNLL
ncbi:hypothetical protein NRK68_34235 (plasmid) [Streptomyces yangpuensis]|uniref:Uncharacterized protein n=2 Tax=Streptomyces TaxID=1883 RepID=A0ABY5Q838_9ACTN|nr:hypothetical protein [Streptomyces yangpuensis]UUY52337.1 hypothetical protein NRK68_34235 [Streptomyces yangpuensis]